MANQLEKVCPFASVSPRVVELSISVRLQTGVNVGEGSRQGASDGGYATDDDERDKGGNQTIFDGGSAGFVLDEFYKGLKHCGNSC